MATYNFLDKTGLGQVWAKIKGLIKQSNWNETDNTDNAFIQNKPFTAYVDENNLITILNNYSFSFSSKNETIDTGHTVINIDTGAPVTIPVNYNASVTITRDGETNEYLWNIYSSNNDYYIGDVGLVCPIISADGEISLFNDTNIDSVQGTITIKVPFCEVYGDDIYAPLFQSDWENENKTKYGYIKNKPSIKAGEGENSIIEGQIDNTEARTWTIYITGDAKSNTFTYTTQDDMSTMSSSLGAHSVYINNASPSARKIQRIESIDKTNNIIVFKDYVSSVALNNAEAIIYYHYKYAEGECSHSEGIYNIAANRGSHAEGSGTVANGIGAHAEGNFTSALGNYSHAEGSNTYATTYSHAEGSSTIALGSTTIPQHVEGKYNIPDYNQTYAHIVGNGTSSARSNAYTLDWSGNEVLAGKLTVGAGPTANMDVATKQYVDNATSGITSDLAGLTDTTITTPVDGQILSYDSTTSKWINADAPTVPTNVSAFTNDSGYLTLATLPIYDGTVTTGGAAS